jgi:hypothetical protein
MGLVMKWKKYGGIFVLIIFDFVQLFNSYTKGLSYTCVLTFILFLDHLIMHIIFFWLYQLNQLGH